MNKIRIGINGLGRIGRLVLRAAQHRDDIEIVCMNGTCPVDYQAYMLRYDTMHGKFDGTIDYNLEKSTLIINGKEIPTSVTRDPKEVQWGKYGADYVIDSTGKFLTKADVQAHLDNGAKY